MSVKQLSTFVENVAGTVVEVTQILADNKINIHALVLSDTIDFGVLRLIVDDSKKAHRVLKENKFIVRQTDVLILPISQEVGSLNRALKVLKEGSISIEYMYAFSGKEYGKAFAVIKTEDLDGARRVLEENNIEISNGSEI